MESNAEIARLSKEVASLRQQLAELRQFFYIEENEETPATPKILSLRCASLTLCNPSNPGQIQGILAGGEEGPALSLWGADQKARLVLKVEKDGAQAQFLGKDLKTAVEVNVDEATGRGEVAVLEAGKSRALLKAAATGGAVSVMHDDNHPRALLHADARCGEFIAVNQDLKTAVKITSDGGHGGLLTIHNNEGKPLVMLSSSEKGGLVNVNDAKGHSTARLPGNDFRHGN